MLLENDSAAAAVEDSKSANTKVESKGKNDADLIVLKGVFSTGDHRYKFEIKSDGTGKIFYSEYDSGEEEFAHEANLPEIQSEIENLFKSEIQLRKSENLAETVAEIEAVRDEIASETLEEFFWEEINPTLEDPFFRSVYDDGEWGEEFQTTRGTVDEFIEFLKLCVLTEREILPSNEDYLVVEAETEFDLAGISECSYYSERLEELVEIGCEYYKPTGFRYDYNDGCYDRNSGYSMSLESVSVSLLEGARAPAREKMLGMVWLKKKLLQMDVSTEKIARLTAF